MAVITYSLIIGLVYLSFPSDVLGKQTGSHVGVHVESGHSQGNKYIMAETVNGKDNTAVRELSDDLVTINGVKYYMNRKESKHMKKHSTTLLKRRATGYKLPQSWLNFCKVLEDEIYESEFTQKTKLTSIKCIIDSSYSGVLTMNDLRRNFNSYQDLNLNFSLDIECREMANISMPWPFKVRKLFVLKIKDCVILDFLAEQNSTFLETPDSLRKINLWNTILVVLLSRAAEYIININNLKRSFYCFHERTIEETSTRNGTLGIMINETIIQTQLKDYIRLRYDTVCNYSHLLESDISNGKAFYHLLMSVKGEVYENLRIYNSSYTNIVDLNELFMNWSMKFPRLEIMVLSHNNISNLDQLKFIWQTNLGKVDEIILHYNRISTITVKDLEKFKQMTTVFLDLRHNPIDCSCSDALEELIQYIKNGKHLQKINSKSDYSYIENMTCKTPENLQYMTLKSLTSKKVCGSKLKTEYFLVPIICLSVAIVVIAILLFTVLRFRQEIAVILFTRFNIIVPCQARENYDSEKKYDAFVSYSSNEEEYVEKVFEDLEKKTDAKSPASFKFCMHHRDFVPGKTIFDNVTFSIESSRHTIVLLSNHFITSEYCLYEFQEAFRQSIMEKRHHLVIVMLEEIPKEDLPRDLRRCVNTFTYIRKDDTLFTERLSHALTIKHKH